MGRPRAPSEQSPGFAAFELAASRNSPLSVTRPNELGKVPMARGRFLLPADGAVIIENLQIPGRRVPVRLGDVIDAFFQHNGEVFQFRSRVIEMDTAVQLNDSMLVHGMKIAAPVSIERGNRRSIYRQSFVSLQPGVDASVWAVPLTVLNDEERAAVSATEEAAGPASPDTMDGFQIERGERAGGGLAPRETLLAAVPSLTLAQAREVMNGPPHWRGEVVDASEFGLGLRVNGLVYSRLKVFQPLVLRFRLPEVAEPMEFLFEIRRVQGIDGTDARVGGIMLINAANTAEVRSARELARFTIDLQRERAKRVREAG